MPKIISHWTFEYFHEWIPADVNVGYFGADRVRKHTPDQFEIIRSDLDELLLEYDFLILCTNEIPKLPDIFRIHDIMNDYDKRSRIIFSYSSSTTEVLEFYEEYCSHLGWEPVKLFFFNHCQLLEQPHSIVWNPDLILLDHYDRSKVFNCLNYGFRHHRSEIVADIFLNNLDDLGYVTYGDLNLSNMDFSETNLEERVVNFYNENRSMFPLTIDNPHDFGDRCDWSPLILDAVNDSFLSVCVEVFYHEYQCIDNDTIMEKFDTDHDVMGISAEDLNNVYPHMKKDITMLNRYSYLPNTRLISEKSYRSFITGTIGIYLNSSHTVDILRNNYDVFDDIVDHSYDNYEDNNKRYDLFMTELKRLCGIKMDTWRKIYRDTLDRRRANLEVRMKTLKSKRANKLRNVDFAQDPNDLVKLLQK